MAARRSTGEIGKDGPLDVLTIPNRLGALALVAGVVVRHRQILVLFLLDRDRALYGVASSSPHWQVLLIFGVLSIYWHG